MTGAGSSGIRPRRRGCAVFNEKSQRLRDIAYKTELYPGCSCPPPARQRVSPLWLSGRTVISGGVIRLGMVARSSSHASSCSPSGTCRTNGTLSVGPGRRRACSDLDTVRAAPWAHSLRPPVSGHVRFEHVSFSHSLVCRIVDISPGPNLADHSAGGRNRLRKDNHHQPAFMLL